MHTLTSYLGQQLLGKLAKLAHSKPCSTWNDSRRSAAKTDEIHEIDEMMRKQCVHTAFTDIQTFQVPASQTPLQPSMDRKLPSSHCSPGWASITAALSSCQRWTPHVENERNDEKRIFPSYNVLPWLPFLLLHVSRLFHTKHPCHSITANGTAHRPEDCSLCCGGITSVSGQFQLWSILNCSAWTLRSYKDIKLTKVNLNTAILQRKKDRCGNLDHETCWGDCLLHQCRHTRGPTGPGNYRRNPTKPQITATLSSQVRNHSVQDTRDTLIKTLRYTVYTLKKTWSLSFPLKMFRIQPRGEVGLPSSLLPGASWSGTSYEYQVKTTTYKVNKTGSRIQSDALNCKT